MPGPVGRKRLPREVREAHQRRRVVSAAAEVFAKKGYPATTVDDLVAAGEVGVGSFYSLFGGKEDCLLATFDAIRVEMREAALAASSKGSDWPEEICLGLRALLEKIADDPLRARIALVEIQTAGATALRRYEEMMEEAARAVAQGRRLSAQSERLSPSLELTTVSGIAWLLHRRLTLGEAASVPTLFDELAELILEPYLGEKRAGALAQSAAAG